MTASSSIRVPAHRRLRAAAVTATALVIGSLPLAVSTSAHADTGTVGDFSFDYVPGSGQATVRAYTGASTVISIPASVVIGGDAYAVTAIAPTAFYDEGLTGVTIPSSVTQIGNSAFEQNLLTNVTIPNSVTSLGSGAFYNNDLTGVTLSSGLTSISSTAFGSNRLSSVTIPSSVTSIGQYAFDNNLLTAITLPSSVNSIGAYAFSRNSLTALSFPSAISSLGESAFALNPLITAHFAGAAPIVGATPLGAGAGLTVTFVCGAAGFTAPTWQGYASTTTCAVAFDPNGGTGAMAPQQSSAPAALPASTLTPPVAHHFAGWNTAPDASGTPYADQAVFPFTANTTLYAQWALNPIASIELSGAALVDELTTQHYTAEAFDEYGASLGDVTADVTLSGPSMTIAGTDATFDFDPAQLGLTRVRTLTATLTADPAITTALDVDVRSAAQKIRLIAPTTAKQGDTIVLTAEALGASDALLGDVTAYVVFTSNVASDVISGNRVGFPHASPHTLTATAAGAPQLTGTAIVEVQAPPAPPTAPTLANTGLDAHSDGLAAGAMLLLAGLVTVFAARSRRAELR